MKQFDATPTNLKMPQHWFPAKCHLKKGGRNCILMTCHYLDLVVLLIG